MTDYEPCGDCGYDHGYEQSEASAAHAALDKAERERAIERMGIVRTVAIVKQRKRRIPGALGIPGPRWQGGVWLNPRVRVVRGKRG